MESGSPSKSWQKSSNNGKYTSKSRKRTKRRKKIKYKVKRRVKKLSVGMPNSKTVNGRSVTRHSQATWSSSKKLEPATTRPIPPITPPPPPPKIPRDRILNRSSSKHIEDVLLSPSWNKSNHTVNMPDSSYEPKSLERYEGKPLHKMLQRFKHPSKRKARILIVSMGRAHSLNVSSNDGNPEATETSSFLKKTSRTSGMNNSSKISRRNKNMWLNSLRERKSF